MVAHLARICCLNRVKGEARSVLIMNEEGLSPFSTVAGTNLTTSVERSEPELRWLEALCCSYRSYLPPSLPSFVYICASTMEAGIPNFHDSGGVYVPCIYSHAR